MTSDDIKSVQIIATTKDGKHIMAVLSMSVCKFFTLHLHHGRTEWGLIRPKDE